MLSMYQQITIKTLKKQGKANAEIGRIMGVHRNTVRNVLSREVMEKQKRNRPSSFSTYQTQIESLLDQGLTKLRVWQILVEEHQIERTYSAFVKFCQDHVQSDTPSAFGIQSTPPGDEAEVDFGYAGKFADLEGKLVKVWVFVMTLSYSRQGFYLAVLDQKVETFIQAHIAAFEYFGGIPRTVKVDNLKAAVITNGRYDLELNRLFLDFSLHYGFVITPCPPRKPHHKGKVERSVDYVKRNFIAGRKFEHINQLNQQMRTWMIKTANQRVHGTTKQVPQIVFDQEEKPKLQSLPQEAFPLTPALSRKVNTNCHIQINNSYYSVPAKYVGEMVEAKVGGKLISIYYNQTLIATHPSSSSQGKYVTTRTHLPQDRVYSTTEYQAKYEAQFVAIGPHAHQFFQALLQKTSMWTKTAKMILGLVNRYGPDKVDKACKRAVAYQAIKASVVKRICEKNLEDTELEPRLNHIKPTIPNQTSSSKNQSQPSSTDVPMPQANGVKKSGPSQTETVTNQVKSLALITPSPLLPQQAQTLSVSSPSSTNSTTPPSSSCDSPQTNTQSTSTSTVKPTHTLARSLDYYRQDRVKPIQAPTQFDTPTVQNHAQEPENSHKKTLP